MIPGGAVRGCELGRLGPRAGGLGEHIGGALAGMAGHRMGGGPDHRGPARHRYRPAELVAGRPVRRGRFRHLGPGRIHAQRIGGAAIGDIDRVTCPCDTTCMDAGTTPPVRSVTRKPE